LCAEKLDGPLREQLAGRFDLLVSFAFGKIFGPKLLALFPLGGLNIHPSLLPRWRGPSPLSAAIAAGDTETGLSIQKLALQMDSGDLLLQTRRPLDGSETTASLTAWAATEAPSALLTVLGHIAEGTAVGRPQQGEVTYCHLVQKGDGALDWTLPARVLDARIRACNPWPGATTTWQGQTLTIWDSRHHPDEAQQGNGPSRVEVATAASTGSEQYRAARPGTVLSLDKGSGILIKTGDGLLVARELQLPARKSLDYRSFLNGWPGLIGSLLGDTP
jgi:methionyl-tRNA formyltransferase